MFIVTSIGKRWKKIVKKKFERNRETPAAIRKRWKNLTNLGREVGKKRKIRKVLPPCPCWPLTGRVDWLRLSLGSSRTMHGHTLHVARYSYLSIVCGVITDNRSFAVLLEERWSWITLCIVVGVKHGESGKLHSIVGRSVNTFIIIRSSSTCQYDKSWEWCVEAYIDWYELDCHFYSAW